VDYGDYGMVVICVGRFAGTVGEYDNDRDGYAVVRVGDTDVITPRSYLARPPTGVSSLEIWRAQHPADRPPVGVL